MHKQNAAVKAAGPIKAERAATLPLPAPIPSSPPPLASRRVRKSKKSGAAKPSVSVRQAASTRQIRNDLSAISKDDRRPRKSELVLQMLARPEGVSIDQLVMATGWQPHTARAALSNLRK